MGRRPGAHKSRDTNWTRPRMSSAIHSAQGGGRTQAQTGGEYKKRREKQDGGTKAVH